MFVWMGRLMNDYINQSSTSHEIGFGGELLYALNAAAATLQRSVRSEREVLHAVSEQIGKLGLRGGLSLLNSSGENLVVRGFGQPGRALDKLEKITGFKIEGYEFSISKIDVYHQVVKTGKTVFVPNSGSVIAQMLPDPARSFAKVINTILGSKPAIFSPLITEGRVKGVLNVVGEGLSRGDMLTMEAFANHIAIALENARLFAAMQEEVNERKQMEESERQRRQEAESLIKATASLTSSVSLGDVLNTLLVHLYQVVPYDSASLFLQEADRIRIVAVRGFTNPENVIGFESLLNENELVLEIRKANKPLILADAQADPRFQSWCDTDYIRGWMGVPLIVRAEVSGYITLDSRAIDAFTEADAKWAEAFANQAAIAIENARLFEQAATERRHLGLLYDVGRELVTSLEPSEILERSLSLVCREMQAIIGFAFRFLPEENCLYLSSVYPHSNSLFADFEIGVQDLCKKGLLRWVAQNRQSVYVPDVEADERWEPIPGFISEIGSAICTPIIAGDQLLGVLAVLKVQKGAFLADQVELLQAISQEIGLVLNNANQYQEVQRRLAEMTLIQSLTETFNQRLSVQDLLEEVVLQLARRLGYTQVEILLVENDQLVERAYQGADPPWQELPLTQGVVGRVARTGKPALVHDVALDLDYRLCYEGTVAELAVPIFHGEKVVGVINIETDVPGRLTDQDLGLIQVLAGQISIALENALLYERISSYAGDLERTVLQRTAELIELSELSQEIGYTLSYEDLLQLLLSHMQKAVQSEVVAGSLIMNGFHYHAFGTTQHLTDHAMDDLSGYWRENVPNNNGNPFDASLEASAFQLEEGIGKTEIVIDELSALMHAPIMASGEVVGVLIAGNGNGYSFGEEQKRLINTFANQAATAIQRLAVNLAAEQQRLESLIEHIPVGVLLLDTENRLLAANQLGRSILSILGEYDNGDQPDRWKSKWVVELLTSRETGAVVELSSEMPIRRIFEAQARTVDIENRQWVITLREVTQERENQARIQMQDRLATVGQLAAGIAHDFNNIMATILVYADLLTRDPNLPPASQERIRIIQGQVQKSASLIRQILDFSRRSVMEQSVIDLLPFLKELEKILTRIFPETIELELTYPEDDYIIQADPTRLQQALMNLAVNARDAMPEGGRLSFELDRISLMPGDTPPTVDMPAGEWIRVSVKDTGIGVLPENMPHIFEPFFTTKPTGQGTGLGLAQVYGIIKQHGGFIDVDSQSGMGTQFTIYLPAISEKIDKQISPETTEHLDGTGSVVLVVEDNLATLEALRTLLETQNYQVLTASNGSDALGILQGNSDPIDLVVSDVVMPQMGGVALYKALLTCKPDAKVLFITGHPLEGQNQALLEGGDVHWLQKPFSMHEFNHAVNLLLQGESVKS